MLVKDSGRVEIVYSLRELLIFDLLTSFREEFETS